MYWQTSIIDELFRNFETMSVEETFKENRYNDINFNKIVDDTGLLYEIAMPGFKKDDVKIETKSGEAGVITIKAEKEMSDKKYTVLSVKRHHHYKLFIDTNVYDLENVKAKMEDGILHLSISKREEQIPKKWEVKVD
jgi:HSP20 family molecular chaperone IbpA